MTENIHQVGGKLRDLIDGNSHVSSPVQCHLQYPHPLPPSTLSIHTVPQHAGPGQDERVQSLRRVNSQPIHNFLQKCRTETTPTPLSGEGLAQERVHQGSFLHRQGHQHHNYPSWKAGPT